MRLEGKVAVVTGGNSGIGLASARRFVLEGARVAVMGRDEATVSHAVEELGDAAIGVVGDVLEPENCAPGMGHQEELVSLELLQEEGDQLA